MTHLFPISSLVCQYRAGWLINELCITTHEQHDLQRDITDTHSYTQLDLNTKGAILPLHVSIKYCTVNNVFESVNTTRVYT